MTMDAITVTNLVKRYGSLTAVDNISLAIAKGEIFGLLGPNGAGKTTTLMILATLLKCTSGSALVNGYDVSRQPQRVRESIGMVFQDPSSDELLTGYENLKLHSLMYDIKVSEIDKRIAKVLDLVDLGKRRGDLVKKYSGGMRRRLEIARGLLHEPAILFLDEPTLGLDPQTRLKIWDYIQTLAKKMNMTIILTTHYMEEAERLCSRIAIIDSGKIVALDSPDSLKQALGGDIVVLTGRGINAVKIRRLRFVNNVDLEGDRATISVRNAGKNLLELLRNAGTPDFVEMHSPNLNDVFLQYTGKHIREDSGNATERLRTFSRVRSR